jgi:dTDP-3-amino-2,3,6-trideoxy-4-keto-D-glucose/dTDP-3-amino-3,4,6-trideoxy-alpha-D-glucose/dTDP-2,6-dideoxy-D-kanosamine transaminase
MIKNWDYLNYYKKNKKKIINTIDKCLSSGFLILGPRLKLFENNFKKFIGSRYGLGVGNCTDAIYIALKTLNIKKNHQVIVPSNTAIPTITAIINSGAIPRFVDCDQYYLIDPDKIEKEINKNTKIILVVHLYGQICDMKKIKNIAKKYNLKVVEDCAQATGASQNQKKAGTFGDIGCFSFYPTKILGAFGDGGFITTSKKEYYNKMLQIRNMGIDTKKKSKKYYAVIHGTNSRLDELQASILDFKLKKINSFIEKRRTIANIYKKILKNTSLIIPNEKKNNFHVYYQYVVRCKNRYKILNYLNKKKIFLKITYPYPVHAMKAYKYINNHKQELTNTLKFSKEIFSLPTYPELKLSTAKKLAFILKKELNEK